MYHMSNVIVWDIETVLTSKALQLRTGMMARATTRFEPNW